jgi:hypothetical protein
MKNDRFAPPRDPEGPPLEVDAHAPAHATIASDEHHKQWRKPKIKYRRPLNTPLIIWFFAFIGAGTLFWFFSGGLRWLSNLKFDVEDVQKTFQKPTKWEPVTLGEGVLIQLQLEPRDTRVLVDGEPAVSNPVRLARSEKLHTFQFVSAGYLAQTRQIAASKAATLAIKLSKETPASPDAHSP